jgi:Cu/Ag efflux protein CusF
MRSSFTARRAALALTALAALLGACSRAPKSAVGPAAHRYTIRGEVVRVADEPSGRSVFIRHEAVPDFVDSAGARVGMASMTMSFPVGPGLSAVALAPGEKIRFQLAVDWEKNALELESVEPLPADTALVFGK